MTNDKPTTEPHSLRRFRAAQAYEAAFALVGFECARLGGDGPDNLPIEEHAKLIDQSFDDWPDDEIQDVGDCLVRILQQSVGAAKTTEIIALSPPGDMVAIANVIAQLIGLDGWHALKACHTARQEREFWDLASEVETDPR